MFTIRSYSRDSKRDSENTSSRTGSFSEGSPASSVSYRSLSPGRSAKDLAQNTLSLRRRELEAELDELKWQKENLVIAKITLQLYLEPEYATHKRLSKLDVFRKDYGKEIADYQGFKEELDKCERQIAAKQSEYLALQVNAGVKPTANTSPIFSAFNDSSTSLSSAATRSDPSTLTRYDSEPLSSTPGHSQSCASDLSKASQETAFTQQFIQLLDETQDRLERIKQPWYILRSETDNKIEALRAFREKLGAAADDVKDTYLATLKSYLNKAVTGEAFTPNQASDIELNCAQLVNALAKQRSILSAWSHKPTTTLTQLLAALNTGKAITATQPKSALLFNAPSFDPNHAKHLRYGGKSRPATPDTTRSSSSQTSAYQRRYGKTPTTSNPHSLDTFLGQP